jgi:7-cyano-7-deazaguanine synthase
MSASATRKAVVLLSGGLDSATVAAIARRQGYSVYALSFDYGQTHRAELAAAERVATSQNVAQHVVIKLDLAALAHSALTGAGVVPKHRSLEEIGEGVPVTYVPARNTVFLSLALAWAESLGAIDIFLGVNALDYSGYPDCRPEFIRAFETMANLATKMGADGHHLSIHTPLIAMTKAEIIRTGLELGVDYSQTSTCYDPSASGEACGACDACLLRLKGFAENAMADPAPYRSAE